MKNGAISLLLLCFWGVSAQNVGGKLVGKISSASQPLELANVYVLKLNSGTSTDSLGNFELKNLPTGKHQCKISSVGYENAQVSVEIFSGKSTTLNIDLVPLTARVNEIVVTGTLKEVRKLESITPVEVYTAAYFQRNPTSNLFDGLNGINGIFADVDNGVSNTTDVQINGLEGNFTMFLLDGVPIMNGLASVYALNTIPMSIIDRIEIIKGASSTLYGSEAIAGVINIKTKNPSEAPRFSANVHLTSMLETVTDFTTAFRAGKANSFLTLSTENSNFRWDIDKDNFMDIPLINRVNVFNKWNFDRKDDKLTSIYGRYLYEDRFGGEMQTKSKERGSNVNYAEAISTHQFQAGLQFQLPVKEQIQLMADFSGHIQKGFFGANKYNGRQLTGFTQLTWTKRVNKIHDLLIGTSYRIQHFEDNSPLSNSLLTDLSPYVHIAGVFMEDEMAFSKSHHLLLGARFDYSNRNGPMVTPRINYKWLSRDEKNVIRAGVGTGYRTNHLVHEGFGALNGSRTIVIEEPLKAEYAINSSINYTRVQQFKSGLLSLDASVFYTRFLNFVEPDYNEDPILIEYENNNLGATSWGFSAYADFTFNFPLKVGFGFTYSNVFEVELDDNGEKEKEVPSHAPPLIANFSLSYNFPAPNLSLDLTGMLVSPMLLSTVPNDFRPEKSKWYTMQNVQVTKKFDNGLSFYFGLKNFFNFLQKDPILRPFDPFNRMVNVNNPNNYRFDTTYGFTSTQGIKAFIGLRYILP